MTFFTLLRNAVLRVLLYCCGMMSLFKNSVPTMRQSFSLLDNDDPGHEGCLSSRKPRDRERDIDIRYSVKNVMMMMMIYVVI
jgi:hypothetical protein